MKWYSLFIALAVLLAFIATTVVAQSGNGGRMYDPKTQVTVTRGVGCTLRPIETRESRNLPQADGERCGLGTVQRTPFRESTRPVRCMLLVSYSNAVPQRRQT